TSAAPTASWPRSRSTATGVHWWRRRPSRPARATRRTCSPGWPPPPPRGGRPPGRVAARGRGAAAGVGLPGLFAQERGRVVFLPTLPPAWTGHEVAGPLAERLGAPVVLLNAARAFTLAESRMGAAAGCPTVVCLTLGTGVG